MNVRRRIAFSASIALLTTACFVGASAPFAQDDAKPQTIEAVGVSFDVPAAWKTQKPTSAMRKAQIIVPAAEGDKDPTELVLFVFPGGAGTVEANVERWRNQFTAEDGNPAEVESTTVKGQNTDVTRVEVAGSYKDPFAQGGPRESHRLYGAIVTTDDAGYFFKMVGPEKTMKQAKDGFDAMIKSIKTK